jgi:hypothetical protein
MWSRCGRDAAVAISIRSQKIVRDYLREPAVFAPKGSIARITLDRLAGDQTDRVASAIARLKPAHPNLVLFYLVQSMDLATSQNDIVQSTSELARRFRHFAETARELAAFSRAQTSMHLWVTLPKLAEELDERANFNDAALNLLRISRKRGDASAEQLLALRHFAHRLRSEFGLTLSCASQKEAVGWLVEVALDCKIPKGRVMEGLRLQTEGHSARPKSIERPNRRKPLKTAKLFTLK